jgi:peptidyl-prolyl cis-trans isomerase D
MVKTTEVPSHWAPNFAIIAFMVIMSAVIFAWMYSAYFAPPDNSAPTGQAAETPEADQEVAVIDEDDTEAEDDDNGLAAGGGESIVTASDDEESPENGEDEPAEHGAESESSLASEEGAADLNDANIRDQVLVEVRNEKKADYITEKIKGLETLDAMKEVFPDASLGGTPDLRLNASVIPGVGFAPKAVGAIFGLKNEGQISTPIKEEIGLIVAQLNSLTPAPEIADFTRYQNEVADGASQRTGYMIMMALEELADVKDYRYKFF